MSNKRLKLYYLAMDYQHILNALHGQRFALIMHHTGRYYLETAVLLVECHHIISGLHTKYRYLASVKYSDDGRGRDIW